MYAMMEIDNPYQVPVKDYCMDIDTDSSNTLQVTSHKPLVIYSNKDQNPCMKNYYSYILYATIRLFPNKSIRYTAKKALMLEPAKPEPFLNLSNSNNSLNDCPDTSPYKRKREIDSFPTKYLKCSY